MVSGLVGDTGSQVGASDTNQLGLRARQSLLVRCLGKLIAYAESRGYELTLGEGFIQDPRPNREGKFVSDGVHMRNSLHYARLAVDLNLFLHGEWITRSDHFAWQDLGAFWTALDPLCRWGGHFATRDGNHFSIEYSGRA